MKNYEIQVGSHPNCKLLRSRTIKAKHKLNALEILAEKVAKMAKKLKGYSFIENSFGERAVNLKLNNQTIQFIVL